MESSQILGFWWVALLLTLTPGSDWAFVISAGVRGRSAFPSIAGMIAGYAAIIAAVSVGLGSLMTSAPYILTAVTVLGSGYLGWMGIRSLIGGTGGGNAAGGPAIGVNDSGWGRFFARGAGVTSVNPNGIMLLLVLLPQFSSSSASFSPTLQLLILGGLFLSCIAVVYSSVALIANRLLCGRPKAVAVASKVSGATMIVLAVLMAAHRLLG